LGIAGLTDEMDDAKGGKRSYAAGFGNSSQHLDRQSRFRGHAALFEIIKLD
jgi:hypothetical protein